MTEPVFVRVGAFDVRPGTFGALHHRYVTECAPIVRSTEGSVDCVVLQSADSPTAVAICTV